MLIAPALAEAAEPGDLDRSFSRTGKVSTDLGAVDGVNSVAMDAQGRIVAGGYAYSATEDEYDFVLARYKPNGKLDRSFSGDGKVATDFGVAYGEAVKAVAIDSEGRIIAAGNLNPDFPDGFAIARYKPDGSLDPAFSGDGKGDDRVWSPGRARANSVAIDSQGRIVIVGSVLDYSQVNGWQSFFTLVRYEANGSLDPSFGDGGTVMQSDTPFDQARSVAIDSADRIVVAGRTAVGGEGGSYTSAFALARYNLNGTPDASFGTGGRVTTEFGASGGEANSLAIDSGGRMVVAGARDPGTKPRFGLARYNPGGTLDASFSGDGTVTTRFGDAIAVPYSVAIDSQGRIVAAGGVGDDFALARYRPSGTLDTSFSGNGNVRTHFRSGGSGARSVAIDSRDRVVAAGSGNGNFALARYVGEAPIVTISGPSKVTTWHRRARAQFSFEADTPASFECKVGSRQFRSCSSSYTTPRLRIGRHRLKVRATDLDGNQATESKRFKIVRMR
jgi:uncharacterized delta-60 repeat protein